MNELRILFTDEELEEIELYREITEAVSIEGKKVVCFELLHKILIENVSITSISTDDLVENYAQLNAYKEVLIAIGIFDISVLEIISKKTGKIILEETNKRRQ